MMRPGIEMRLKEGYMIAANAPLAGALIGMGGTIANAMDANPEFVPCGRPAGVVMDNLVALGEGLPAQELDERTQQVSWFIGHVHEHHGAPMVQSYDASELSSAQAELLDNLIELAALALPALQRGTVSQEVSRYLYQALAAIARGETEVANKLATFDGIKRVAQEL